MPLSAAHQAARRHKVKVSRRGQFNPEPDYIVEAGDSEGIKFRWIIQYGYDFQDSCNAKAASISFDDAILGCLFPKWMGRIRHGRFSKANMFRPSWCRIIREGIVESEWGNAPADGRLRLRRAGGNRELVGEIVRNQED